MATPAQIAANRENAQHSTGPRSQAGKLRAAKNASRHWLTSEAMVALPGESADELRQLADDLREELAPETALEAVLVQRIVSAVWRLRRACIYENGVLRAEGGDEDLGLAFYRDAHKADALGKVARYVRELETSIRTSLNLLTIQQARRRGQSVPLPVSVDITVTGDSDGSDSC